MRSVKAKLYLKYVAIFVLFVAIAIAGTCYIVKVNGNFHVLIPQVAYRSGQMDRDNFARKISTYKIRSVLNLRGASNSSWYVDEISVMKDFGVMHYDYKLSASEFVSAEELMDILDVIDQAPKPILVHCEGGADRTGLVAAAAMLVFGNATVDESRKQLSVRYGHFPHLLWSSSKSMDESFDQFVRTMHDDEHGAEKVKTWPRRLQGMVEPKKVANSIEN